MYNFSRIILILVLKEASMMNVTGLLRPTTRRGYCVPVATV